MELLNKHHTLLFWTRGTQTDHTLFLVSERSWSASPLWLWQQFHYNNVAVNCTIPVKWNTQKLTSAAIFDEGFALKTLMNFSHCYTRWGYFLYPSYKGTILQNFIVELVKIGNGTILKF